MTSQEVLWAGKLVCVTGILSKSGKLHMYVGDYVCRKGRVIGEAKNGMLKVRFSSLDYKRVEVRNFPAGCLTEVASTQHAR